VELAGAIAAYEAALARNPRAPNSWYNLARLQRQAGRFEAALACYGEALRRGAAEPEEIHLNRAVIYADDLARSDLAQAELESALALNPRYVPALLNLGNLHEDRGERREATETYERALAIEPHHATGLARLVGVAELAGEADPVIERVRARIACGRAAEQAELGFALGQALDRLGAYDSAFAAYRAANEASRRGSGARYDRAAHERLVERLIEAFPQPVALRDEAGEAPLFICGMFRSGSTLAEQMLAQHSRVRPGGELDLIPAIAAAAAPYPETVMAASPGVLAGMRDHYLQALRTIHPQADLVTDKRPDNFLHIGLIKSLFPEAKIVHTVRQPLDNCLSVWFLHLDPSMAYALDLQDIAHWYRQYRRLMAHWRSLYPEDIHDLDYDALVTDPRPHLEALLEFCGLEWEDDVLRFHQARNAVRTASAAQVREPLYRRSSGRWRNYERHIGPLREALGELA
jgi:tetratricopeptide (TPR) repeat protein